MGIRKNITSFILYFLRWESSSFILAPCIALFGWLGTIPATIIANAVGAAVFFWVDRLIFKDDKK